MISQWELYLLSDSRAVQSQYVQGQVEQPAKQPAEGFPNQTIAHKLPYQNLLASKQDLTQSRKYTFRFAYDSREGWFPARLLKVIQAKYEVYKIETTLRRDHTQECIKGLQLQDIKTKTTPAITAEIFACYKANPKAFDDFTPELKANISNYLNQNHTALAEKIKTALTLPKT
ncbi:MAG: hypothetical protein WCK49_07605 [Myxococcaceae bacterium]